MAYQKRNFKKDQLLTADDLNAMDDQIASNEESAKKANDDIKNKLDKSAVVKEKGDSETAVMSQAASTIEFNKLSEEIADEVTARNTAIAQERNRAVARENEIERLFSLPTQEAVDKWLDEHPEATTTVEDGSLEVEKLTEKAKSLLYNYVTPMMFGAKGDGVTADNVALQKCFDYMKMYGVCYFDGLGKTYCIDDSTESIDAHHGVYLDTSAIIHNAHFKLKDGTGEMTPVLTLNMGENTFYKLENCVFDGNMENLPESTLGSEDGGCHCLLFTYDRQTFPKDFGECKDVYINSCRFISPLSYGIFLAPCDNNFTVINSCFETYGPCILPYSTNSVVRNCQAVVKKHYRGMAYSFCHDEIEFGKNYAGTKKKSLMIDNCHVDTTGFLFKCHHAPQYGVNYGNVVIKSCSNKGDKLIDFILDEDKNPTSIDRLVVENCDVGNFLNITRFNVGEINVSGCDIRNFYIGNSVVNKVIAEKCLFIRKLWFTDSEVEQIDLLSCALSNVDADASPFFYGGSYGNILLRDCAVVDGYTWRLLTSPSYPNKLTIENFHYPEMATPKTFIDIQGDRPLYIDVKNSQFLCDFAGNGTNFIYVYNNSAPGTIILQNVLFKSKAIVPKTYTLIEMNCAAIDDLNTSTIGDA